MKKLLCITILFSLFSTNCGESKTSKCKNDEDCLAPLVYYCDITKGCVERQKARICSKDSDCLPQEECSIFNTCIEKNKTACSDNKDCSSTEVCVQNNCKLRSEACSGVFCPSGQMCKEGSCIAQVTHQQFCNQTTEYMCDFVYKCFSQSQQQNLEKQFNFSDKASCNRVIASQCEEGEIIGTRENRQKYNPDNATLCLEEQKNHPCTSQTLRPQICENSTTGLVSWRGSCTTSRDCSAKDARCIDKKCTDELNRQAFQKDCSELTSEQCPGNLCIGLKPNFQNKTGICSAACASQAQCREGSGCFRISETASVCFALCQSDSDCINGFVCTDVEDGKKTCLVKVN